MFQEKLQEKIEMPPQEEQQSKFCGRIHRIRKEAENLLEFVDEIRKALNHRNANVRQQEVQAVVAARKDIVVNNIQQITRYVEEAKSILDNTNLDAEYGDSIVEIENVAEMLQFDWPKIYGDPVVEIENSAEMLQLDWLEIIVAKEHVRDLSELSALLDRVDRSLKRLWNLCGKVTAASRVRQHLEEINPGRAMNFHDYFSDEIPDENIRAEFLRYLSEHPRMINGVINVETGDIYCAAPKENRWRSLMWITLTPVLVFVLGVFLFWLSIPFPQWPLKWQHFPDFAFEYIFVFLGGIVHLVVDFVKRDRASKGTAVLALEDWMIWVHVREGSFIKGAICLVFGAVALFWLFPAFEWQTAFFVGYSIDSFLDIFLLRFTTFSSQGIADAEKKIRPQYNKGPTS